MSRGLQTDKIATRFRKAGQIVTEIAFCEETLPDVMAGEGSSTDARHFAIMLLVGMVSQARKFGRQPDVVFGDSLNAHDFQKVRDLANRAATEQQEEAAEFDLVEFSPEQILERWQTEARRIVKVYWSAIKAAADIIEENRSPSAEEVRQFINDIG